MVMGKICPLVADVFMHLCYCSRCLKTYGRILRSTGVASVIFQGLSSNNCASVIVIVLSTSYTVEKVDVDHCVVNPLVIIVLSLNICLLSLNFCVLSYLDILYNLQYYLMLQYSLNCSIDHWIVIDIWICMNISQLFQSKAMTKTANTTLLLYSINIRRACRSTRKPIYAVPWSTLRDRAGKMF